MIDLDALKACFDALPYAVFAKNSDHVLIYGNKHFGKTIGVTDFVGKTDFDLFSKEQADIFRREDKRVFEGHASYNEEKIGDTLVGLTSKFRVEFHDGSHGLVGILLDMQNSAAERGNADSEERFAEPESSQERVIALETLLIETVQQKREALQLALTDPATGLRNRNGLDEDLTTALARFKATAQRFGLAFVDLDYFKKINDRLGHDMGDAVLKTISARFLNMPGLTCAARLGGDEFALVFDVETGLSDDEFATAMGAVHEKLSSALLIEGKTIHATASTGIALYPDHANDLHELKRHADAALLTSKAEGRDRVTVFSNAIRDRSVRRRLIEDGLQKSVANGAIHPAFQPIVCSQTKSVLGVEVLARWSHPQLGAVSPDEFIEIAEDCGLLSRLDRVVFENGCRALAPLLKNGQVEQISFNVSPAELTDIGFAPDLLDRIQQHDLLPKHICIEIVETSSIHDIASAKTNLDTLHDAGVCIALDDFGTGFSNLRSLLDLPLDKIKIDRSFVKDMETNQAVFDLFLTIVSLAGILEVSMVAEGLESDFNALMVASAGVTHLQGYYFAKPMSLDQLHDWLQHDRTDTAAA